MQFLSIMSVAFFFSLSSCFIILCTIRRPRVSFRYKNWTRIFIFHYGSGRRIEGRWDYFFFETPYWHVPVKPITISITDKSQEKKKPIITFSTRYSQRQTAISIVDVHKKWIRQCENVTGRMLATFWNFVTPIDRLSMSGITQSNDPFFFKAAS